jgi:hypothetical protein
MKDRLDEWSSVEKRLRSIDPELRRVCYPLRLLPHLRFQLISHLN